MKIIDSKLIGVKLIEPDIFKDDRGSFTKTFHVETFSKLGLNVNFDESFYSVSTKDVIRGMHFQVPPADHAKLVYVTGGKALDVVLDLRKNSQTYGKFESFELSAENHKIIYIPRGFAHGFLSLEDNTCMVYLQETMRSAEHEAGIKFDSFGMNWGVSKPIVSKRDGEFPLLDEYNSPFK